jgi:hypothetical protein
MSLQGDRVEVHPPHHPLHTWKDFWIHLGTITIGLLIALGLEASVEWVHRVHERHMLQRALLDEARRNQQWIAENIDEAEHYEAYVSYELVQEMQHLPENHPGKPLAAPRPDFNFRVASPDTAVWLNARQSGTSALLPDEAAQLYTDNFSEEQEAIEAKAAVQQGFSAQLAFVTAIPQAVRWTPGWPEVDTDKLSADQIRAHLQLLAKDDLAAVEAVDRWRHYGRHNACLLEQPKSEEESDRCTQRKQDEESAKAAKQ